MSKLSELKEQFAKAKAEQEELGLQIEAMEKKEWPKEGDRVWFIDVNGEVLFCSARSCGEKHASAFLGLFRTREEAEAKRAVLMAIASPSKIWVPENGVMYWFVDRGTNICQEEYRWGGDDIDLYRLATNNVFKFESEAKAYADLLIKYGNSLVKK